MSQPFAKVCSLLFLLRDDEILLAMKKRGFGSNRWNGVGGKRDIGESIEQTTVRECQEEIGILPSKLQKVAIHSFIFPDDTPDMEVHAFLCHDWEGEPIETEEMAPRWFKIKDIPYAEMWEDDIIWLPCVLQGHKLLASFVFDAAEHMIRADIRLVDHFDIN